MQSPWRTLVLLFSVGLASGCAEPPHPMRATGYEIGATVDPAAHTLAATTAIRLVPLAPFEADQTEIDVDLELHPDLAVDGWSVTGAELRSTQRRAGEREDRDEAEVVPSIHRLRLAKPTEQIEVTVHYHGTLHQDVAAGEKDSEVHNFAVSAHIGEEGLYLEPSGYWYPIVDFPDEGHSADLALADFRLSANVIEGVEYVAGLEREADQGDGRVRWSSPFPLEGAVLLGGPFKRWSRRHGEVMLHAVLPAEKEAVARDILDASAEYLDRYQPLIGPYPFSEFTLLEAFFSSGFAFPTCTQIVGSQLSEYQQYRRHGYLDHELLHNWWGNGVFVDPEDGNWCEGLSSYLGNYYGFILDGDEAGARKQRRNQSNFLSAIKPEHDKPLGDFGLDDGPSRGIGYQKSAGVFHMLSRKIGQDALFAGLRRLTAEQVGGHASWSDLQDAFEEESGADLGPFFEQWVRRSGAPVLELTAAAWQPGSDSVEVTISQGATDFALDVPLRLHYGARTEDVVVSVEGSEATVGAPCESIGLTAVELDPDYHLFRRLKPEETMPTTALVRRASSLLIVVPDGDLAEGYQAVIDSFSRAVLGEEDDPKEDHEVIERIVSELRPQELEGRSVIVLGEAARHPEVSNFLARTRSPVHWETSGFSVETDRYEAPGHAVLATVHHPDRAEDGVMVYFGNSPGALANARVLSYYANSLLVFDTPIDEAASGELAEGMPRSSVVRRTDFEFHDRIDF